MNSGDDRVREVFGARAAFYVTSPTHTDTSVLDRVVGLARPEPAARALDVGTAAGHTALALAPHVGDVVGVDITPEMLVEAGKLRVERGIANVRFVMANATSLPFGDLSFDIVTCRRAAHHFSDVARALVEMRRVLKPGGRLVIDDRSVPEDDFVDSTMNHLDRLHDASHVRQYRVSEWSGMLRDAGLAVESIEQYTRHRPLTSLTADVEPEAVAQIGAIIAALSEEEGAAMSVVEKAGQIYTNHWYVMIAAVRGLTPARS